ncbi:MAG: VWA domain-containing protein [Burkholderiales bacterium]|nr:VWA domain-containing protein [Burkholderiales bacterium]
MSENIEGFILTGTHGAPGPVLCGVQASGRLDGVHFELTLRQTYRNTLDRVLEVVYSFPLPAQAVLLGFAAELNGQRKVGMVTARALAERRYEQAMTEGDAPVMLEAQAGGLHTANIGNLKPGDEIVLEIRFAQLLAFEQGRLRLAIPTTIAPRYGNPQAAGLRPQQVPVTSLLAEYPLALSVMIGASLAQAAVECPTHAFTRRQMGRELLLDLQAGAFLDRDVVLVLTPREPCPSLLVQGHDAVSGSAPHVMLAAFQTRPAPTRGPIAMKLLVDCSGSMGGDSIASARRALLGVLDRLEDSDQVSLSRFGSSVEHLQPPAYAKAGLRQRLAQAVNTIDATLGGTEMLGGLKAAFGLRHAPTCRPDVLLITDGQVWDAQPMIDAARASGHRVFAIGVGAAPAECVLRQLAEATGGACEFATPGESLEAAAQRMLARVRQVPLRELQVDWGQTPAWQSAVPATAFGGDTVMAFAGFAAAPAGRAVKLLATREDGTVTELARGEAAAPVPHDSLARLAAFRRLAQIGDPEASRFAVAYGLLTRHTNCVLVHQRAEADKAATQAELHRVESMLAAGWGASSSVFGADVLLCSALGDSPTPAAAQSSVIWKRTFPPGVYALLSIEKKVVHPPEVPLQALAEAVADYLDQGRDLAGLPSRMGEFRLHALIRQAKARAVALGIDKVGFWLVLAQWVNDRDDGYLAAWIENMLRPVLATVPANVQDAVRQVLVELLGEVPLDGWPPAGTPRQADTGMGTVRT